MKGTVYLIPTVLEENALQPLPAYLTEAVKKCKVFFVENERTTRRFLKKLWREMVIDDYRWYLIPEKEGAESDFLQELKTGDSIGILSEAGCPGIADPGSLLVAAAHRSGATVRPLVGPNSIVLALMGSGLNGQQFHFHGYLPVESDARNKKIKELELISKKDNCTQIFIETPYRNSAIFDAVLQSASPETRFCIAVSLTGETEMIRTRTVKDWKQHRPELHKQPAIFLLLA